jgi:hypothetical protein
VPKKLSLRLSSGEQSIFWILVLWSILLGKSEFKYWMFFGGLSMFLVCIYSNFKCYHKLNPSTLQIEMILGCSSTEILQLCMGFTVTGNLRTPHFYHHKLMFSLLSVILWQNVLPFFAVVQDTIACTCIPSFNSIRLIFPHLVPSLTSWSP